MTWRAAPVKRGNLNCSSTFLLHGQHPAEPPSELKDWLHLHPLSDFILLNNGCFSFRSSTLSCVQSDRFLTHREFQQTHLYILSGFQQNIIITADYCCKRRVFLTLIVKVIVQVDHYVALWTSEIVKSKCFTWRENLKWFADTGMRRLVMLLN